MFFSNYDKLCHPEDYLCADVIRSYPHSDSDLEHIVYVVFFCLICIITYNLYTSLGVFATTVIIITHFRLQLGQ